MKPLDHRRSALLLSACAAILMACQLGCPAPSTDSAGTNGSAPNEVAAGTPAGPQPTSSPSGQPGGQSPDSVVEPQAPKSIEPQGSDPQPPDSKGTSDPAPAVPPDKPDAPPAQDPAEQQAGDGESSEKPREKLFDGWPKPRVALVFTGNQSGYLEPCGCTGLANQKGGLARRQSMLQGLAKRGWDVGAFDTGSQVRRYGAQAELKFRTAADALAEMPYYGVAFGDDDLRLSVDALLSVCDDEKPLFFSANANVLGVSATHRIVEIGGLKIGVTAVVGDAERQRISSEEIEQQPALEGLQAVWPKLESARCDLYILLAHASLDEARALAKQFPKFDLLATSGGASEPAYEPEKVEGSKTLIIQSGHKGMYAGVLGVFSEAPRFRFQRVAMSDRFADSSRMLDLMKAYQVQLKTVGFDGLGIRPLPHPSGRKFVGSENCRGCHKQAWEVWIDSDHAHATDSIKSPSERVWIERHFDPECLSCHVTGWSPQKYFPYASGYLSYVESKPLHGNGCENCHGPGSAHVAAERAKSDDRPALRLSMRLAYEDAEKKCLECHDLDNSPDFHREGAFEDFWDVIAHPSDDQ